MKKFYIICGLFTLSLVGINLLPKQANARINGSNFAANYSGASGATCNTSGCHTGSAVNSGGGNVAVSTDIPAGGYIAGTTYSINVTITAGGTNGNIYGFACSATKDGLSTLTGGFAAADNSTLIKSGGNYIVHKVAVNGSGTSSSHTFTFNWTAPAAGTGAVKFYAAGNSGNGDSDEANDKIYTTTVVINEASNAGLAESIIDAFNLYPNPATELVNVKVPEFLLDSHINLLDVTGKAVMNQQVNSTVISVDINSLPAGIYVVQLVKDGKSYTSRLVKQ